MTQEKTRLINDSFRHMDIDNVDRSIKEKIAEYRAILVLKNIKQADIARNLGVSRSAIARVINGQARSKYIEKALSKHGINLKELYALMILKEVLNEN